MSFSSSTPLPLEIIIQSGHTIDSTAAITLLLANIPIKNTYAAVATVIDLVATQRRIAIRFDPERGELWLADEHGTHT